jgi:hypothetical protein
MLAVTSTTKVVMAGLGPATHRARVSERIKHLLTPLAGWVAASRAAMTVSCD